MDFGNVANNSWNFFLFIFESEFGYTLKITFEWLVVKINIFEHFGNLKIHFPLKKSSMDAKGSWKHQCQQRTFIFNSVESVFQSHKLAITYNKTKNSEKDWQPYWAAVCMWLWNLEMNHMFLNSIQMLDK